MKTNYINSIILIIIVSFISSCSNDDDSSQIVNLEVKHYRVPAVALDLLLTTYVREGDDPNFRTFYNGIEGFTHELGFDYELLVKRSEIENPPADGSSIRYELIDIVSQTPGSTTELFEIGLAFNRGDFTDTFITGDDTNGFQLLNTIDIDCSTICNELNLDIPDGTALFGTFTRNNDNAYVLVSTTIL